VTVCDRVHRFCCPVSMVRSRGPTNPHPDGRSEASDRRLYGGDRGSRAASSSVHTASTTTIDSADLGSDDGTNYSRKCLQLAVNDVSDSLFLSQHAPLTRLYRYDVVSSCRAVSCRVMSCRVVLCGTLCFGSVVVGATATDAASSLWSPPASMRRAVPTSVSWRVKAFDGHVLPQ
jgi:hypothetical protein